MTKYSRSKYTSVTSPSRKKLFTASRLIRVFRPEVFFVHRYTYSPVLAASHRAQNVPRVNGRVAVYGECSYLSLSLSLSLSLVCSVRRETRGNGHEENGQKLAAVLLRLQAANENSSSSLHDLHAASSSYTLYTGGNLRRRISQRFDYRCDGDVARRQDNRHSSFNLMDIDVGLVVGLRLFLPPPLPSRRRSCALSRSIGFAFGSSESLQPSYPSILDHAPKIETFLLPFDD